MGRPQSWWSVMCPPEEYTNTLRMVAPASSNMLLRSPSPSLEASWTFASSERYALAAELFLPLLKLVFSLPPPVSLPSPPVILSMVASKLETTVKGGAVGTASWRSHATNPSSPELV